MPEPSGPVNGQNRVVEGLVSISGVAGLKKGSAATVVAGSVYQALDTVVDLGHVGGTAIALGAATSAASIPVVLASDGNVIGILTETAPATDIASSGLNGRLQRIAQNITTLIAAILKVGGDVAHAAVDSGNPVKIGGRASSGGYGVLPIAVTPNDRVNAYFDVFGRLQIGFGSSEGTPSYDGQTRVVRTADADGTSWAPVAVASHVFNAATWDRIRTPSTFKPQNAVLINAETTIWTPAAGKKFRVMGYHLTTSVAGNIILRDNTAGAIIAIVPSGAGGSGVFVEFSNGILSATANNVLTAIGPAASTLSGMVFGTEE